MNKTITDVYLIAALMAYGFHPLNIDRSDSDRQRYVFNADEVRPVYLFGDKSVIRTEMMKPDEIEVYYMSTLMYPPSYPQMVKTVKYSIMSSKVKS